MSTELSDTEMLQYLKTILSDNDLDWKDFEWSARGNIIVSGIKFCMRVGLHMKRPCRAIVAERLFIRLQPWHEEIPWDREFMDLNPSDPDVNLFYSGPVAHWHPSTVFSQQYNNRITLDDPVHYNPLGSRKRRW